MALGYQSLLLYGFEITPNNQYVSFSSTTPQDTTPLVATIPVGFYTLAELLTELCSLMTGLDGVNTYSYSINRTIAGNTQNRVTISSTGSHFKIFFSSGNPSNPATLLGFTGADLTGATSYTSSSTAGVAVIPDYVGYSYKDPNMMRKNFGTVNISASGYKESIVFALQQFMQVQFKYETKANLAARWQPLIDWMIQQRPFEFTPEINNPTTFYAVTLEDPNKGLELEMAEMLPNFPNYYETPLMKFRVVPS